MNDIKDVDVLINIIGKSQVVEILTKHQADGEYRNKIPIVVKNRIPTRKKRKVR
jgi:hypothetical protein